MDLKQMDTGFEGRNRNLAKMKINPLNLFLCHLDPYYIAVRDDGALARGSLPAQFFCQTSLHFSATSPHALIITVNLQGGGGEKTGYCGRWRVKLVFY